MKDVATKDLEQLAARLHRAELDRIPVAPLSERPGGLSIADAYAVQRAGAALRKVGGGQLVGMKVGLTSEAMQRMLGVDQPDLGYLLDDMVHASGASLAASSFVAPRVEGEIAFRLGADLPAEGLTVEAVMEATDAVAPAIEVIDSRIADWRITIADTIADNASCGCVVLGSWSDPSEHDLAAIEGTTTVAGDGAPASSRGPGSAVLGHPAAAVVWLAETMQRLSGDRLRAGQIVLPGAVSQAVPVAAGTRASVSFAGLGEAHAEFT